MSKDTDLWVVAEALDAIFDVFGEDHIDAIVREIGLVEKLKTVAPVLKSKVNYCPFDISQKDVFCLAFYFK